MVDYIHDTGGVVDTPNRDFHVVALFRVQMCNQEGTGILDTNAVTWYQTLRLLRIVGQLYHTWRVVTLLIGSYAVQVASNPAFARASVATKLRRVVALGHNTTQGVTYTEMGLGLRVPCQVVVHGSWLPVTLFAVAHAIDSPMLYRYTTDKWASVAGAMTLSYIDIMTILSSHMRNIWLMTLAAKITLLSYSLEHLATHGVPGVRGNALISASFITISLTVRLKSIRSTQILQVHSSPPSDHLGLVRVITSLPFQLRTSQRRTAMSSFAGNAVTVLNEWLIFAVALSENSNYDPTETMLHPLPLKRMATWRRENDGDATVTAFRLIGKHHLMALPWSDRLCDEYPIKTARELVLELLMNL
ncbi:Aste57867_14219 [Aphanomyces stellatus]|uniref:Aste57867_14219 protein n=1 Tax=Aphanomyces stellatus TaxID=120398 RepID=A0A485L032_9STRA|nr:hypothetical protein As57867_014168 [Aphanomyces stellatus]VFT91044.1 Aste57867_14219 [Aphanomyces stellatus]